MHCSEQCWPPLVQVEQVSVMEEKESEHAEAFAALTDGQLQHLVQLLVGVVGGEAQLVKTTTHKGCKLSIYITYELMNNKKNKKFKMWIISKPNVAYCDSHLISVPNNRSIHLLK